jgi:uncharacterized repeat protein (TIGR03803 family)
LVDSNGHERVLHNFTGSPTDGAQPQGVSIDAAGNLYGVAIFGGATGWGIVYRIDPSGTETILHNFTNGMDGGSPRGPVILDSAGTLYGTTIGGGMSGCGVLYKIDASGHQTVLYAFLGKPDACGGYSGLVFDAAGNLYGTTSGGGTFNAGTVFKLDTAGHETVLYSFTGGVDGAMPQAGVIPDSAGYLYGTTTYGGTGSCNPLGTFPGCGATYRLAPLGHLDVLHTFSGNVDGGTPSGGLVMDGSGNLYGAVANGGRRGGGVVFELKNAVVAP